jgi:adenine-specific DNA methylase
VDRVARLFAARQDLQIPNDDIPDGDETKRLHRWGYRKFREMFNTRQLFSLGILLQRVKKVADAHARHALATVFSDCLRYQNMLCRYDEYALKCQDIFAVHGFPVGLIQCENNVLGIPKVGTGGFRHFVEKFDRAKQYCDEPFETVRTGKNRKKLIYVKGESIQASMVNNPKQLRGARKALLRAGSIEDLTFPEGTFDAVFTDPPYFDNVQYAELMDFCYAWLRVLLNGEFKQFAESSTRSLRELTGNNTAGKDLAHFTEGLSRVFTHAANALKPGAPFVFTYHHNDVAAYVPIVVSILDAGLTCTASLPCPAEMTASLHINGTGSSVVDTIIVCRKITGDRKKPRLSLKVLRQWLEEDRLKLAGGGVNATKGDLFCLALGHLARIAIASLRPTWDRSRLTTERMETARKTLSRLVAKCAIDPLADAVLRAALPDLPHSDLCEVTQPRLFD